MRQAPTALAAKTQSTNAVGENVEILPQRRMRELSDRAGSALDYLSRRLISVVVRLANPRPPEAPVAQLRLCVFLFGH
jgi:hypothetical protein